ncbi:LIM and SH3 domain protein 1-like [Hemiscyllium ocellatum]|uniref:LIM and SH3 domain protein 1-like n=1 Tax=Hemiscyllium ocellatum TaxID=170820 RepID=UPI002966808F|nr:LIM and SH3 domain protein 1-like [Hemiscyllium ocellatum]
MNPSCARCKKIVYPTEKVNCLDKFWHKACFQCEVCKMTLNMKNYKGYDKKPYCNAHYPKSSFTAVADTPENLRLKKQSKLQSQVQYKEDFEKNKGKGFSAVANTPELERIKKNQELVSNIKYHEEFEKSKGTSAAAGERRPSNDIPQYNVQHEVHQGYQQRQEPQPQVYTPPAAPVAQPPSIGKRYRAVYDYAAADDDEISFLDGDLIIDVQQIDEGWMYGTVERTGDTGMLPANYVEAV